MVQDTAWVKWPVICRKVTRGATARLGCLTMKKLEKSDGILTTGSSVQGQEAKLLLKTEGPFHLNAKEL